MFWTQTAEAAHLLDSCARKAPRRVTRTYRFSETATFYDPSDPRVGKLRRLYRASEPKLDTPEWAEWLAMTAEQAITDVIVRGPRKAAA